MISLETEILFFSTKEMSLNYMKTDINFFSSSDLLVSPPKKKSFIRLCFIQYIFQTFGPLFFGRGDYFPLQLLSVFLVVSLQT